MQIEVNEIKDFIRKLDPETEIIENDTTLAEIPIDVYLPEYNLAIRYLDLIFNSQGRSYFPPFDTPNLDKDMQVKAANACEEKGIQLLQIFENEWKNSKKRKIWESVIRNKMHKNPFKVGARKCDLVWLDDPIRSKQARAFLEENHLQGAGAVGSMRVALFYEKELVSLMTFGRSRFHKTKVYELLRFVNYKNVSVQGAASRLLKAFLRKYEPPRLVSYANRRWSDGGLYKQLGFVHVNTAQANYFYFHLDDMLTLSSRNSFQKHKLEKKLAYFDPNKTEFENMSDLRNAYRRIFDAGNHVFEYPGLKESKLPED